MIVIKMFALTRVWTTIFICRQINLNLKMLEELKRFLILVIIAFNSYMFKYQLNLIVYIRFSLCNLFSLIEVLQIASLYILNASAYISHLI